LLLRFSWLLLTVTIQKSQGSLIGFQVNPGKIINGLTSNLNLHCNLSDTAASGGIIGKRDTSHTLDNMVSVSSMVIMKDGHDMASVSSSVPAHVMDGSTNVQVLGSVLGNSGENGFLQLNIAAPSVNETGEYICEVNAVSQSGHIVTFSSSLEVEAVQPTVADLVAYVQELQKTVAELKSKDQTVVAFNARLDKTTSYTTNQVIIFDLVLENTGNDYNNKNGEFVCEIPGYYDISVACVASPKQRLHIDVFHNDDFFLSLLETSTGSHESATNSAPVKLAKGDVVKVVNRDATVLERYFCSFSGHLFAPI